LQTAQHNTTLLELNNCVGMKREKKVFPCFPFSDCFASLMIWAPPERSRVTGGSFHTKITPDIVGTRRNVFFRIDNTPLSFAELGHAALP
jgi:hypothetical protein